MKSTYDVVVVGGGTAGVIAAVQAGRAGARTLLVEKSAILGGAMTQEGINAPAHFFAWGKQVISGIGWELVQRTLEETGQPVPTPEFTRDTGGPQHLPIDIMVYAALCDEAVLAAGVELLFHTMPASAHCEETGGWALRLCTKTGLRYISAKVLIDATGDANLVTLAGYEVVVPSVIQPATLQTRCSGYDAATLDYRALKIAADTAIAADKLKTTDISWANTGPEVFLRRYGRNANHVRVSAAETSEGRSAVETEARQTVLRMYRFFRKQPGLENFRVDWICPQAGIRETVTITGKQTVTVTDYETGKVYDDAVCYAFYPIDEHLNDGKGGNSRLLQKPVVPTIPRGALLPAKSHNLIVAGRCLASDREANSALRVQCPCMAMGQAAGALAALSAQTGVDPEAVPLADLYHVLKQHGAIVPETQNVLCARGGGA